MWAEILDILSDFQETGWMLDYVFTSGSILRQLFQSFDCHPFKIAIFLILLKGKLLNFCSVFASFAWIFEKEADFTLNENQLWLFRLYDAPLHICCICLSQDVFVFHISQRIAVDFLYCLCIFLAAKALRCLFISTLFLSALSPYQ